MTGKTIFSLLMFSITLTSTVAAEPVKAKVSEKVLARGRYLAKIAGCNDCHTPGYAPSNGNVPEKDWLTGDALGWRGPWGTTFPINLRLLVANMTEDQWITLARNSKARPPMPVYIMQGMEEDDLKAIFQLIKHLGAAGSPAPDYVPPDQEPKFPFVSFPSPPPAP